MPRHWLSAAFYFEGSTFNSSQVNRISSQRGMAASLSLAQDPTSLDIPIGEDGVTLADIIEAPEAVNPYTAAEAAALRDCVAEALAQLTPREERILRMRFGIGMPDHTLEQVGESFGPANVFARSKRRHCRS